MVPASDDDPRFQRLFDVGKAVMAELDTEAVLERILADAREMTGAQRAGLGVIDEERSEVERFLGLDGEAFPPTLPPDHPPTRGFLGVPIVIRGRSWGNLYLTEKRGGGEFTQEDEDTAKVLAQWAAIAIENARLYESSEQRREEAERAVRGLQAARSIADAIAGVDKLDRVLKLIVRRGRALIEARTVLIMLREGDELVVAASAGHATASGQRLPISGSTSGEVLRLGRPERIADVSTRLRIAPSELGVIDARSALLVPMLHRGVAVGVLAAFDRGEDGHPFTEADEQLLRTFASSAANAVVIRRSVEANRLRSAIDAADSERRRWARELHDQTLQSLGGLRVLLASTLTRGDADWKNQSIRQAVEELDLEIENLRGIINDLRPSLLDDLGLRPAIEALIERRRGAGFEVAHELVLPDSRRHDAGLPPELATAVYRLVQESLTNVVKHAEARFVRVSVKLSATEVAVEVRDDGVGFDPRVQTNGFGLIGMRERVYLAGGSMRIEPAKPGTLVSARLPLGRSSSPSSGPA